MAPAFARFYFAALARWWWVLMIGPIGAIIGLGLDIFTKVTIPPWGWAMLLVAGVALAQMLVAFEAWKRNNPRLLFEFDWGEPGTDLIWLDHESDGDARLYVNLKGVLVNFGPSCRIDDASVSLHDRTFFGLIPRTRHTTHAGPPPLSMVLAENDRVPDVRISFDGGRWPMGDRLPRAFNVSLRLRMLGGPSIEGVIAEFRPKKRLRDAPSFFGNNIVPAHLAPRLGAVDRA